MNKVNTISQILSLYKIFFPGKYSSGTAAVLWKKPEPESQVSDPDEDCMLVRIQFSVCYTVAKVSGVVHLK